MDFGVTRAAILALGIALPAAVQGSEPGGLEAHEIFSSIETAPGRLIVTTTTDAAERIGDDPVRVRGVPLGADGPVDLELRRFHVATERTRFVRGRDATPVAYDPDRVVALRGGVAGRPDSRVLLVLTGAGGFGVVETAEARREVLVRGPGPRRRGAAEAASAPVGHFCGSTSLFGPPAPADGAVPDDPTRTRVLELAVETDYEFRMLQATVADALDYVVAVYAVVSDTYRHDVNVRVDLAYVRIWDDPDDLFNEPDPLLSFRDYWNANMGTVQRDAAQLLSGRRDLPYGGTAYLSSLCSPSAYSIVGYVLGAFPDPDVPSVELFDVLVAAHELGHNAGAQHTHDYGIDDCDEPFGDARRGTIMSYCSQTRSGWKANVDRRFHTGVQQVIRQFVQTRQCLDVDCGGPCGDCNGNGIDDAMDISGGSSADVDLNGVPDECQADCNANELPDVFEIALGLSTDAYGNGVPDECEADCNGNGIADYTEIQADMSRDIDRDAILDECQDCDGDGIIDLDELMGANDLWIATLDPVPVGEFHEVTGVRMRTAEPGWTTGAHDVVIDGQGRILVSDAASDRVVQFDRSGAYNRDFVTISSGLDHPTGMAFGPNGDLYVASRDNDSVLEFDGATGDFVRVFVAPGAGGLLEPYGLAWGPDGHLYVTSRTNEILAFDGQTGGLLRTVVPAAANGGLVDPHGIAFNADGRMLVTSFGTDAVLEYDWATGAFVGQFNHQGTDAILTLEQPWGIRIGPDHNVYVSRHGIVSPPTDDPSHLTLATTRVYMFDWTTGNYLRSFVNGNDTGLYRPTGFDFYPSAGHDCNRNGRPDSCDIAAGVSLDANGNGLPDECECPADVSGDDDVGFSDILVLIGAWGTCPPTSQCPADVNGDGTVGFADLLLVIGAWGPCP